MFNRLQILRIPYELRERASVHRYAYAELADHIRRYRELVARQPDLTKYFEVPADENDDDDDWVKEISSSTGG
jgi:hypothetical protein